MNQFVNPMFQQQTNPYQRQNPYYSQNPANTNNNGINWVQGIEGTDAIFVFRAMPLKSMVTVITPLPEASR